MTREQAIETINELWISGTGYCPKGEFNELCEIIIKALEQKPRWIPVSERLPEDYKTVIASVEYGYVCPEARYSKEEGWQWAYESGTDYWQEIECDVVAWMPLPKPYEPKEREGKE